jgi:hypothetical protein
LTVPNHLPVLVYAATSVLSSLPSRSLSYSYSLPIKSALDGILLRHIALSGRNDLVIVRAGRCDFFEVSMHHIVCSTSVTVFMAAEASFPFEFINAIFYIMLNTQSTDVPDAPQTDTETARLRRLFIRIHRTSWAPMATPHRPRFPT